MSTICAAIVLLHLQDDNLDASIALLGMVDEVRGYGPVKDEAIKSYRAAASTAPGRLLRGFHPEEGRSQVIG
jgi:hypothetical protein